MRSSRSRSGGELPDRLGGNGVIVEIVGSRRQSLSPTIGGVTNLQIDIGSSVFNLTQTFSSVAFLLGEPVDLFSMIASPGVLLTGLDTYLYSAGQQFGAGTLSFSSQKIVTAVPEPSPWALIMLASSASVSRLSAKGSGVSPDLRRERACHDIRWVARRGRHSLSGSQSHYGI
jgi:hypothetical protein